MVVSELSLIILLTFVCFFFWYSFRLRLHSTLQPHYNAQPSEKSVIIKQEIRSVEHCICRVHKSIAELCSNFGDLAITKGQIAYFSLRMRKKLLFLLSIKIWRHHRVRRSRFPIRCRNFGGSSINMGQIAYFSLRMRETPIILLPVKNLTSPSCSPTPISYDAREFWRYVNI